MKWIRSITMFCVLSATFSAFALKVEHKKVIFEDVSDVAECSNKHEMDDCLRALDSWLKRNPGHALEAAQMVRKNSNAYNALPYYRQAVTEKKVTCDDVEMLSVTQAGLGLPKTSSLVAIAKDLAFKVCFKEWKDDLANQTGSADVYYLDNSCAALRAAKALNAGQQKACTGH